MEDEILRISDEETLKACINTLRDVLNEMCCTLDDSYNDIQKLVVSRKLDKLIIEYMDIKK